MHGKGGMDLACFSDDQSAIADGICEAEPALYGHFAGMPCLNCDRYLMGIQIKENYQLERGNQLIFEGRALL